MNTETVCIFPDIVPRAEILFPLVQVFGPIVYLRPVEDDNPSFDDLSAMCKELVASQHISYTCPAPLGKHRDRFLALIHDLQNRRDDYAGQLSQLSLAGLGKKKSDETKTSIIGALLKQSGLDDPKEEQRSMILWQARLLLKLGEFYDREQKDLQKNLRRIAALEQGILVQLRKAHEQPFSLTKSLSSGGESSDGQQRLRLKAWSRLFGQSKEEIPFSTFVTANRDAVELLLEQYAGDTSSQVSPLLTLELPGGSETENFSQQVTAFQNDAEDLFQILNQLLASPDEAEANQKKMLEGPESNWTKLINTHYPESSDSRCTLTLYRLKGVTAKSLFLESFGRDEDDLHVLNDGKVTTLHIGLLEEQPAG